MDATRRDLIRMAGLGCAGAAIDASCGVSEAMAADSSNITLELTGLCLIERYRENGALTEIRAHLMKGLQHHAHSAIMTVPFKRLVESDIDHRVIVDGDGDPLCLWQLDGWDLEIVDVQKGFCSFTPKPCEEKPWMTSLPFLWNSLGWTADLRTITGRSDEPTPVNRSYVHSTLTLGGARDANCAIPRNRWGRELVFQAGYTPRRQAFSDRVRLKVRSTATPMKLEFKNRMSGKTGYVTLADDSDVFFFATPTPRASGAEESCDRDGKVRLQHFRVFYDALSIEVSDAIVPIADCPDDVARNQTASRERILHDEPIGIRSIEPVYCPPALF